MMPPKMAIQTIQVRGGTLNSPPFLGFFSSSLCLLSSDIMYPVAAKLPSSPHSRNLHELKPSPHPMQAAIGGFSKLKPFRNPQALYPKRFASGSCGHHQFAAVLSRNLLIHE